MLVRFTSTHKKKIFKEISAPLRMRLTKKYQRAFKPLEYKRGEHKTIVSDLEVRSRNNSFVLTPFKFKIKNIEIKILKLKFNLIIMQY